MAKQKTLSAKISEETEDLFRAAFERSGAFTKDEFIKKMLSNSNEKTALEAEPLPPVVIPEPEVIVPQITEVEPKLERNEILISLNREQLFALRETVLGSENFATEQNALIDKYCSNKEPFLYFGNLYNSEFNGIWVRYQEINKYMTDDQKESAIKHNMAAFLLNVFYTQLIEGNLSDSVVNAENLKARIQKNATDKSLPLQGSRKPVQTLKELQSTNPLLIEVERKLKANEILIALNPEQLYALSETVLGSEDFATEHNSLIDDVYNNKRPFLYSGNLYDTEFHCLYVRFQEPTKNMTEDQKESATKHNMAAFLLNVFFIQLLMGKTDSVVNAENLKSYIQENTIVKNDTN